MRTLLAIFIGLSILFNPCIPSSSAQTGNAILPTDLIITTLTEGTGLYTTLMRVDAQTLQLSSFYVDEGRHIQPISWSPDGELLAFLRAPSVGPDLYELCLLTREGVLQTCFEDRIASKGIQLANNYEPRQDYWVTWSEDGRYIFYTADYDQYHWDEFNTDDWGSSLVKAEVATGQTQEVLYQPQVIVHRPPPQLYWTDDLHYLWPYRWDLTIILDLWQNTEIPLPQNIPTLGDLEYCPKFSPQGSYLTARTYQNETFSGFALVSPEGQIVHTVGSDRLLPAGIADAECPTWQSDEAAFYFLSSTQDEAKLFKYDVAQDTLIKVKQIYPPEPQDPAFLRRRPRMPIRVAPDNATLAIIFYGGGRAGQAVHILLPTGEWAMYGGQGTTLPEGINPIWVPPQPEPPTPTCQPTAPADPPTTTVAAGDTAGLIVAISAANANPDPDLIVLEHGTYTLTAPNNTLYGKNGLPVINTPIIICGNCATIERDPAAEAFRLFYVSAAGNLTLYDLTLTGGDGSASNGGAIYSQGTVSATNTIIG